MKLNGVEFHPRGANKKYVFLDDLDWLYENLKVMSMSAFAKLHGCPFNSVRSRVMKYFTAEMKASIIYERVPHSRRVFKRKRS